MLFECPKIAIIGIGNVGGTTASLMAFQGVGNIYLYDKVDGLAHGKAMDINHAVMNNLNRKCVACNSIEMALYSAQIVIVSGGVPRQKGLSRNDLVSQNIDFVISLGENITSFCPNAIVLIITNPVDALTTIIKRSFPEMNICGLGCSLDTVRFKHFLAEACGVSKQCVSGLVIGAHNDQMLPLTRYASIASIPIIQLLTERQIQQVVNKTRTAGHFVVNRFKTKGSFVAASVVIADIIKAILQDLNLLFSLSVYCQGPYGIEDCCVSLPVVVGYGGVKRILEINLNDKEKKDLALAVETINTVADRYTLVKT